MKIKGLSLSEAIKAPSSPFPGLRPFEYEESDLFFGRDGQVEKLIDKLAKTRFLAVVGTSGSGKSSLVRAGLLPALVGGMMTSAGSKWRIAIMRPGNDPIGSLAVTLNQPDVFGSEDAEGAAIQIVVAEATLRRGSRGLVETVCQNAMASDENLLVVVDQFEELFRFAREAMRKTKDESERYRNEAAAFVKLLLDAVGQRESNIYVVLTMRSDFLGDCAQFWDLPEAINESQYLIPRLTRAQLREVIAGPVALCDGEITTRLVTQLLNDISDNQDELPVLQHLLMRVWNEGKEKRLEVEIEEQGKTVLKPHSEVHEDSKADEDSKVHKDPSIDLCCYKAVGGMARALSRHADEAFNELPSDRHREVAEKLFKALTEKGSDNREIRRPITLGEICSVAEATPEEVVTVIETFRQPGRSFLMPPPTDAQTGKPVPLTSESMIDISHESLIRNWERLKEWVDEESRSARIYLRMAETAVLHFNEKKMGAGLWRNPDLQIALDWREKSKPNRVWARRYHPDFELAERFLYKSVDASNAEIAAEEARRRKEINRTRLTAAILGVFLIIAVAAGAYAVVLKRGADAAKNEALAEKKRADAERDKAVAEQLRADEAKYDAFKQKTLADEAKEDALEQKKLADEAKDDALEQKKQADIAKDDALEQQQIAVGQAELAQVEATKGLALGALKEKKTEDALTHFNHLNERYQNMKDYSGQAYALSNMAEIHRDRVPFALFASDTDLDDFEGESSYLQTLQRSEYSSLRMLEGKDDISAFKEFLNEANQATSLYNQALEKNKQNTKDKQEKDANIFENLGDIKVGLLNMSEDYDLKETRKETGNPELEAEIEQIIAYYTQARTAYQNANMPLGEAVVLRKIANLLWSKVKKPNQFDVTMPSDASDQTAIADSREKTPDKYANGQQRVISYYKEASDAYGRAQKPLLQAAALARAGEVYLTLPEDKDPESKNALAFMQSARDIYRAEKSFSIEGSLNEDMAVIYGKMARPKTEQENNESKEQIYREQNKEKIALYKEKEINFYKEAYTAYYRAAFPQTKKNYDVAAKPGQMLMTVAALLFDPPGNKEAVNQFFEEALNNTGDDLEAKAGILYEMVTFYTSRDAEEAVKYLKRRREVWHQAGNLYEEGNALVEIGNFDKNKPDNAAAIESYEAARKIYQKIDAKAVDSYGVLIRPKVATRLTSIATFYASQNMPVAITVFEEALDAEMLSAESYGISQIVSSLGTGLLGMKTEEAKAGAERLFKKAQDYYDKNKGKDAATSLLTTIGDIYKEAGEKELARPYYEKVRAIRLADKSVYFLSEALGKIATLEAESNPEKSVVDYYLSEAEAANRAGDKVLQGAALEAAGRFYRQAGNNPEAIKHYEGALAAYRALGLKSDVLGMLRTLSGLYRDIGNKERSQQLLNEAELLSKP